MFLLLYLAQECKGISFTLFFYEGTKENGTNLVLGNCFFSLCLGREVATLLFFQQAAHIPTAIGTGVAMKKIVGDSWQH